jgi:hypothetical protein
MATHFSNARFRTVFAAATCVVAFVFINPRTANAAPSPQPAAARAKFEGGDLKGTKAALEKILLPRPKITGQDLEEAQKLYGVTLFLMGRKQEATDVFRAVLNHNPKAALRESDVLDPALADLFAKLKEKASKKAQPSNAAETTLLPKAPGNAAMLTLNCNVKKASVFIDDLFVGTCVTPVTLEPGKHEISVSAEGYSDKKSELVFKAGQSSKLDINLEKYDNNSEQNTQDVFGAKPPPPEQGPNEADPYTMPLPAPQQNTGDTIQLQQLQDGSAPEVFMQPAPYARTSPRGVIPRRSYGVAFIPFGAGQFQNGEPGKGSVFLLIETAGIGTFVYAYFKNKDFNNRLDQFEPADADKYQKKLKLLKNSAVGVTGLAYLVGVIDALVNIQNPAMALSSESSSGTRTHLALLPQGGAAVGVSFRY